MELRGALDLTAVTKLRMPRHTGHESTTRRGRGLAGAAVVGEARGDRAGRHPDAQR
jgi:hypothetical protein